MRGGLPFALYSRHAIDGNGCSGYDNMSTGRVINGGLLYLWMCPGGSPTSFPEHTSMPYSGFRPYPTQLQAECHNHHTRWDGIEFFSMHDTPEKEMHIAQAVSVFGVVTLWVDSQTSMSFLLEKCIVTPIEMAFWLLM
ncbi:hypothetical protein TNCV_2358901 [Trichonephila clavipes]|nr:hypothetical protein TNCV_2358901 [Trichonephila clavipes]